MRAVIFSDIHFHLWTYGASREGGWNSRLMDQIGVVHQITNYVKQNEIRNVFFCGDLFHTHQMLQAEVMMGAWRALWPLAEAVDNLVLLVGNHDMADKAGYFHTLPIFKGMKNVTVVDREKTFEVEGVPIHCLPYTDDEAVLRDFLDRSPDSSVVLGHQGITDVPVNSKGFTLNEILRVDMVPSRVVAAFFGHYHTRAQVTENVWIPGAPLQLTWTDKEGTHGWLEVTVDGKTAKVTPVDSIAPKFIERRWEDLSEAETEDNFVRVILPPDMTLPSEDRKDTLMKKYKARSVEITVENQDPTPSVKQNFGTLEELFADFVKDLDERTRELGKQIVEGKYVAPETPDSA